VQRVRDRINAAIVPTITPVRALIATAFLAGLGCGLAAAEDVPLPRPRPALWVEPQSFAEAVAGLDFSSAGVTGALSDCDGRLAGLAEIEPMPRLIGPGDCGGGDMVELDAVLMPDKSRIAVLPPALLNCGMAESLAGWLRDEAAPRASKLGSPLTGIENYGSYECRSRNRVFGAKLSEHAHGYALDVRAFHLADGRRISLTDEQVDKPLREGLHESACRRFTTVLGPGDPFHGGHIHLDVIQRRGGYRICQWDVREPSPPAEIASVLVPLPIPRPLIADAPVKDGRKL
jgi:hypothetical protein